MIFETKANLTLKQIEKIKNALNSILLEDLTVFLDNDKIAWYTDDETIPNGEPFIVTTNRR